MSWVTLLWSMDSAFCFTLAGIYLLVWFKHQEAWEHLLFSCSALAAGVIAGLELTTMRAETTALHRGKRTMVWQTRVTNDAGRLLSLTIQTQMVLT